jgi:hypothetical protein
MSLTSSIPAATIRSKSHRICWQGWHLLLPRRWDPVKLEGDHAAGYALFADSLRPRLGLRWSTPKKRGLHATRAVEALLRQEISRAGVEAAKPFDMGECWSASMLYTDPRVPGRDLWVGFSPISGRLLQIAYHVYRREHLFARRVLPSVKDLPMDRATPWSIFDLTCIIPAEMALVDKRFNVGDLGMTFADRRHEISIRQIALAELALARKPLDDWIADQQRTTNRHYKVDGAIEDASVILADRVMVGRRAQMTRKRRTLLPRKASEYVTYAVHDDARDRIMILHGMDEALLRQIAATVGEP